MSGGTGSEPGGQTLVPGTTLNCYEGKYCVCASEEKTNWKSVLKIGGLQSLFLPLQTGKSSFLTPADSKWGPQTELRAEVLHGNQGIM